MIWVVGSHLALHPAEFVSDASISHKPMQVGGSVVIRLLA
jgi:hypothetical protein